MYLPASQGLWMAQCEWTQEIHAGEEKNAGGVLKTMHAFWENRGREFHVPNCRKGAPKSVGLHATSNLFGGNLRWQRLHDPSQSSHTNPTLVQGTSNALGQSDSQTATGQTCGDTLVGHIGWDTAKYKCIRAWGQPASKHAGSHIVPDQENAKAYKSYLTPSCPSYLLNQICNRASKQSVSVGTAPLTAKSALQMVTVAAVQLDRYKLIIFPCGAHTSTWHRIPFGSRTSYMPEVKEWTWKGPNNRTCGIQYCSQLLGVLRWLQDATMQYHACKWVEHGRTVM